MNEQNKDKDKEFPPGIHHYIVGHSIAFLSIVLAIVDYFFVHSWKMAWLSSVGAILGESYALDDLIGDCFHKTTPIKWLDQLLKRKIKRWRNFCAWLDKKFGKKIQTREELSK
jgi:hypothetical protein